MGDTARSVTISIYDSQIKKIQDYRQKHKRFKSEAAVFQHIINSFFQRSSQKQDIVFHFIYPIILILVATFGSVMTSRLLDIAISYGIRFAALQELMYMFVIIGSGTIGLFIANMYWFVKKYQSEN